jgi:alkylhydroperoxidase family enzyme
VGRKAGLTDDKLRAVLGDDMSIFNETERLVIELADAMVTAPSNVSDDLYARLRNQFSEEQLMQLSAQIAFEIIVRVGTASSMSAAITFTTANRVLTNKIRLPAFPLSSRVRCVVMPD